MLRNSITGSLKSNINQRIEQRMWKKLHCEYSAQKCCLFFNQGIVTCPNLAHCSPPETEEQLLAQAQQLSGYTLGELAALAGLVTPENLKRDKGWIGVLLEIWLGASAGSKPEQDFAALAWNLKLSLWIVLVVRWKQHSFVLPR